MSVDYDRWKQSNPYDYERETPEDNGYIHESNLPNHDDTREYLTGIMESIYTTGNVETLENCLEELCAQYEIEFKLGETKLEMKNKNRLMHWYLGYQEATIENMRV